MGLPNPSCETNFPVQLTTNRFGNQNTLGALLELSYIYCTWFLVWMQIVGEDVIAG